MEEIPATICNSQYALQLALQTMKDRCVQLQKRIATLEEENLSLKLKNVKPLDNVTHVSLQITVSKLTEEKNQLKSTIAMVASENKQLWSNLSRLTSENKNLGTKLHRISDTFNEHSKSQLIRSRTFTQEAPHTKHLQKVLSENDKISMELEDISLKLQSSYSKEKNELELQVFEMTNIKDELHSLGFNYLDEHVDDSMTDSIEQHLVDLKNIKMMLQQHNDILKSSVEHLDTYRNDVEIKEIEKKKLERSATQSIQIDIKEEPEIKIVEPPLPDWGTPDSSMQLDRNMDKICPMCNKKFHFEIEFDVFSLHVEEHFLESDSVRL